MVNKTWAIGEYAKGGVITVEIKDKKIVVIGKEWDDSVGHNKNSDQSNAKEFIRLEVKENAWGSENEINEFLNDLTTAYYADQILTWIKANAFIS